MFPSCPVTHVSHSEGVINNLSRPEPTEEEIPSSSGRPQPHRQGKAQLLGLTPWVHFCTQRELFTGGQLCRKENKKLTPKPHLNLQLQKGKLLLLSPETRSPAQSDEYKAGELQQLHSNSPQLAASLLQVGGLLSVVGLNHISAFQRQDLLFNVALICPLSTLLSVSLARSNY